MTLSGICASLGVVGNIPCAEWDWNLGGSLSLEGFQHHFLEFVGLPGADPFVSAVGELLGLEADAGVELHFEPLTGILLDPLAVDALVLLLGPRVPELMQLKALVFQ